MAHLIDLKTCNQLFRSSYTKGHHSKRMLVVIYKFSHQKSFIILY